MAKRKSITKKTRFEVFKRDSFTCQYCGESAPEVVLNLDHIVPVAKGGGNELVNLITSCFSCNSGKRDRELSDDTVVKKQMKQLKELQSQREQVEMIAKWAKESNKNKTLEVDVVDDILKSRADVSLTTSGRNDIKKHIRNFGLKEVMEALDIALDSYSEVDYALSKIGGICHNRSKPPIDQKIAAVFRTITKNLHGAFVNDIRRDLSDFAANLKSGGHSDEFIIEWIETDAYSYSLNDIKYAEWNDEMNFRVALSNFERKQKKNRK